MWVLVEDFYTDFFFLPFSIHGTIARTHLNCSSPELVRIVGSRFNAILKIAVGKIHDANDWVRRKRERIGSNSMLKQCTYSVKEP